MASCEWCGKELVEVDNPTRREFRHRRGEEAQCPGPPRSTPFAEGGAIQYERQLAGTPFATNAPAPAVPALAACPRCGGTWWAVRRAIKIAAGDFHGPLEPPAVEHRSMLRCEGCDYSPYPEG